MKKKINKDFSKSNFLNDHSVAIIILVRMDSKRLKNKAILKIYNTTIIEILIKRLKKKFGSNSIILCTSSKRKNLYLKKFSIENKIKFFMGSNNNIFKRILDCKINSNLNISPCDGIIHLPNLSAIERLSKVHIHHKKIILILIACLWVQDQKYSHEIFRCQLAIDQNSSEYLTYFLKSILK